MSYTADDEIADLRADAERLRERLAEAERRLQAQTEALRVVYHRWARGDLTGQQAALLLGQHVGINITNAPDWKRPPDPCPDLGLPHAVRDTVAGHAFEGGAEGDGVEVVLRVKR